jgi:hypothetical protein
MLMVIFGAGASYDSSPTYTPGMAPPTASADDHHNDFNRPPLAKDLFANRPLFNEALNAFPECKTIVPILRDPAVTTGRKSIETLLREFEQQAEKFERGQRELMAIRRYLQRAIAETTSLWLEPRLTNGITNYRYLLREIERTHRDEQKPCLVTFNYDTLIEHALEALGLPIAHMDDYTRRAPFFRLFKLHGSVNWGRELENQFPKTELQPSDRFALCDPSTMRSPHVGHTLFPAIAIPVEKKRSFECPPQMLEELADLLPHVKKILVIGWRATEEHFLAMLGNKLTGLRPGVHIHIVAGPRTPNGEIPGEGIKASIFGALPDNPPLSCSNHEGGFTDFVRSGLAVQVLTS